MTSPACLIVSREPLFSAGVRWFMLEKMRAPTCLEARNPSEATGLLLSRHPGLILVVAAVLSDETPRWVRDLHRGKSPPPILVVGRVTSPELLRRVFRAGALGFVTSLDDLEDLRLGVEAALHGSMHMSAQAGQGMMLQVSEPQAEGLNGRMRDLSDRQMEVFDLIGRGLGQKEIAHRLSISVKTVETHKQHLKEKLRLPNAAQLSRAAVSHVMHGVRAAEL